MKLAVLSDVHSNRPAFDSVLDDVARARVDGTLILGDLVGYNAERLRQGR